MSMSYDEWSRQQAPSDLQRAGTGGQANPQLGWGDRVAAGFDAAAGQVLGIPEAIGDALEMDTTGLQRRRLANENEHRVAAETFAQQRGVPQSVSDVDWTSPSSIGKYAGAMAADSLPATAAILGTSLINPGLGAATAYGAATGDILQSQRERTGGATGIASAAALAVPYGALEFVPGGIEAAAVTRSLPRAGIKALDDITGVKGYAARAGVTGLKQAVSGAATETGQEFTNVVGARAVDPTQELFGINERERYLESAVGGALLEAGMGSVTNYGGRSDQYREANKEPIAKTGWSMTGTGTATQAPAAAPAAAGLTPDALGATAPAAPAAPTVTPNMMQQPPGPPAAPAAAPTPEQAAAQKQAESDQQLTESIKSARERLGVKEDGTNILGTKFNTGRVLKLRNQLNELDALLNEKVIDEDQHRMGVSMLRQGLEGEVKNEIKQWRLEDAEAKKTAAKAKPAAGTAAPAQPASTAPVAAPAAPVPQGPAAGAAVPAASGATVSGAAEAAAVPGAPVQLTSTAAAPEARVASAIQGAAGQTQGQKVVAALEAKGGKQLDERQRQRIYSALGFDTNGEPTGLPRRTWDQVARVEADRAGTKPLSEDAIRKDLKKAGVDVTMLDQISDALDARHQQEVSTLTGKGDNLVEEDIGDKRATMGQDEVADATEAGAYKANRVETGLRETTDVTSHAGEEQGYFSRARDALEDLSNPEVSGQRLNEPQLAAMGQLKALAESLRANPELTPDMRRDTLLAAANNTMKDRKLWPDDELHKVVSNQLAHGKTRAAEARKDAVVKEAAAAEKVDPNLVAANQAQIAKNLQDREARENDAELMQQWRDQKSMSAEGRLELLHEELRRTPEAIESIPDARQEWADLMEPGDDTELAFDDLDADLQAAWVKFMHALNTEKDEAKYNRLEERRTARMGEVMSDAQKRGNQRNRYGTDQGAPDYAGQGNEDQSTAAQEAQGQVGPGDEAAHDRAAGAQGQADAAAVQAAAGGNPAGSQRDQDAANAAQQRGTGTLENIERITMTGAAPAGTETVTGRQRAPSLKRAVRNARALLDRAVITADQFAAQTSAALDAADNAERRLNVPRQRGALILREKLLAAQRRGELTPDMVEFADWLLRQNPQWATDLGLSLQQRTDENAGTSGFYTPMSRILTLIKGGSSSQTAVHEILHHIERMMPTPLQNAIRREWAKQLARAHKRAQKGNDENLKAYYQHLMDYHYGEGGLQSRKEAMKLLKDGKVLYDNYQLFNSSEFWAINGTDIMQARFDVSESLLGKMRQWLSELVQRIKGAFGLRSNASIIGALNSLAQSDGQYQTGMMISGQDGVHFMYSGPKAASQERLNMMEYAQAMEDYESSPKDIWLATGWVKGPDGKWRDEFSDKGATFTQPFAGLPESNNKVGVVRMPLSQVLNHPELYARYPAARDISFVKPDFMGVGTTGGYDGDNTIMVKSGLSDKEAMSTLLHEVQHWVQKQEGFAPGGNAGTVISRMDMTQFKRFREKLLTKAVEDHAKAQLLAKNIGDLLKLQPLLDNYFAAKDNQLKRAREYNEATAAAKARGESPFNNPTVTPAYTNYNNATSLMAKLSEELAKRMGIPESDRKYLALSADPRAQMLNSLLQGSRNAAQIEGKAIKLQDLMSEHSATLEHIRTGTQEQIAKDYSDSSAAMNAYKAIFGEVEARDTQARIEMTEEERAAQMPYESQKVLPEDYLVLRRTGEVQASQDEPGFQNIERITQGFPPPVKKSAVAAHDLAVGMAKGKVAPWMQAARFTRDIINSLTRNNPNSKLAQAASKYMARMDAIAAARLHSQREVARIVDDFKKLPQSERDKANKFMHDSTLSGKWGFVPSIPGFDPKIVDPEMARRFQELGATTQPVVMSAFKHARENLLEMQQAVMDKAKTAFEGDAKGLERFTERFAKLLRIHDNTPYLPLKRFGDWAVVGKSQAYMDAEDAGDAKLLEQLELDPAHYEVSYRETRQEAEALRRDFAGRFDNTDTFNRDSGYADAFASGVQTLGLIARMRNAIQDENVSPEAHKTMAKLLTDFELSMLQEQSVRQSERRRKGITGADPDMMRSFGTKGMSEASFIAAMRAGGPAEDALGEMKREANRTGVQDGMDRETRMRSYNEIAKRHYMGMDYKPSPLVEGLMRAASIYQLVFSPAYHIANALQPLTMSAPWIGGRYGMPRTYAAFFKAYGELAPNITKIAKAIEHDDYSGLPEDVRKVVQELVDRGAISADMIFEHGRRKWKTDDPANPVPRAIRKTNDFMDSVGSTVELTNRITTAMVAYRLAGGERNHAAAADGAYRAIYETHGDYSGFNAPRAMRHPVARLLTQYRKFQFIQLGLWGRLMRDAINKDGTLSKDERKVAMKQLAWSLGSMFAWGGALALPGAQVIGNLLKAIFGDDDEPFDEPAEMKARRLIGDPFVADLILKGIPQAVFGVDVGSKVGAGMILSPLPYGQLGIDRESMEKNLTSALGPFAGLLPKAGDGVSQMWQGNLGKGAESLLPNGFANMMKAWRYAFGEGVTSGKGDVVLGSDEIGLKDALAQAIGFPAGDIAKRSLLQESKYNVDQYYKDRTGEIKRAYIRAYRNGDSDALAEARNDWQHMQAARKARGYTPSPLSDLIKAPREQAKKERSAIGGVVPGGKRDAGALRQMEELTE